MNPRSRCVLLTPAVPAANGSGLEQRAFAMLVDLARDFEVSVILISTQTVPWVPGPDAAPLIADLQQRSLTPGALWGKRAAHCLPPLVLLDPAWTDSWTAVPPDLGLTIPVDLSLAVFFRLRTHLLRPLVEQSAPNVPKLMDLDDLESSTLWSIAWRGLRRGRIAFAIKTFSTGMQHALLERSLLSRYDVVAYANQADAAPLRHLAGKAKLFHRPNRARLRPLARTVNGNTFTLLFLGTLSYFPNEDAALWVAERLVPALRRRMRTAFRILIAGRQASPYLRRQLERVLEIQFLGAVGDVETLYRQAHVAVSPVRCGGGTKVKVLEAVASMCPVIATPHSLSGLPFLAGQDLLEAESPDEFAVACVRLADDPDFARTLAEHAFATLQHSSAGDASPHHPLGRTVVETLP